MSVDKKLLWRAWPGGDLAMRGVSTVGGWVFSIVEDCGHDNETCTHWMNPDPYDENGREEVWSASPSSLHLAGDFLPNVDPDDAATWACLLKDLAKAIKAPTDLNLMWVRVPSARLVIKALGNYGGFQLATGDWKGVRFLGPCFDVDTDDPGLALVLAFIQLREREAK